MYRFANYNNFFPLMQLVWPQYVSYRQANGRTTYVNNTRVLNSRVHRAKVYLTYVCSLVIVFMKHSYLH